ncbi:hypothetical protein GCM10010222_06620 [Streptomyces tanashiensis]|nr:hypothetical protein GCM10010222_06620 [Streptomyces tanashiensis]
MAWQSPSDWRPSTVRPRNFSTCFWYGPVVTLQDAACAGAVPSAIVIGTTSDVIPAAMPALLPMRCVILFMIVNSP